MQFVLVQQYTSMLNQANIDAFVTNTEKWSELLRVPDDYCKIDLICEWISGLVQAAGASNNSVNAAVLNSHAWPYYAQQNPLSEWESLVRAVTLQQFAVTGSNVPNRHPQAAQHVAEAFKAAYDSESLKQPAGALSLTYIAFAMTKLQADASGMTLSTWLCAHGQLGGDCLAYVGFFDTDGNPPSDYHGSFLNDLHSRLEGSPHAASPTPLSLRTWWQHSLDYLSSYHGWRWAPINAIAIIAIAMAYWWVNSSNQATHSDLERFRDKARTWQDDAGFGSHIAEQLTLESDVLPRRASRSEIKPDLSSMPSKNDAGHFVVKDNLDRNDERSGGDGSSGSRKLMEALGKGD